VLDRHEAMTNICPLIGHGTLRTAVMGSSSRHAGPDEIAQMGVKLRAGMEAGAFGMSSGLIYPPGVYANTEELSALVGILPANRVYATHMRNESDALLASVDEALDTVRRSEARLHVSHLKSSGLDNFGRVSDALERLDTAADDGILTSQDVYPYDAASTFLSACLPPWMHKGGADATLRRLDDRTTRERLRSDIEAPHPQGWENLIRGAGGYSGILIVSTNSGRSVGKTIAELSNTASRDPFDVFVDLLRHEGLNTHMVEFCMSETDVATVMAADRTVIGSDGLPPGLAGTPHPRQFGSFPRVLARFVRERATVSLTAAIEKMTALPASLFGIPERGRVEVGMVADLVCFDPDLVGHAGDYRDPWKTPTGIDWVMVAGQPVITSNNVTSRGRGQRLVPA
jgi:N-acyl-D-aspartate/D-glutamate deacylase